MAWATLFHDLLLKIFSHLKTSELLCCRRICQSWLKIAQRDVLWLPLIDGPWARRVPHGRGQQARNFGVFTLMEVALVLPRTLYPNITYEDWPWHPRLHTDRLSPSNLALLWNGYRKDGTTFFRLCGLSSPDDAISASGTPQALTYRKRRGLCGIDRIVNSSLRILCLALCLSAATLTFLLYFSVAGSSAVKHFTILDTLGLTFIGMLVAILWALIIPVRQSTLACGMFALACLLLTRAYWFEYPYVRMLLPFALISCVYFVKPRPAPPQVPLAPVVAPVRLPGDRPKKEMVDNSILIALAFALGVLLSTVRVSLPAFCFWFCYEYLGEALRPWHLAGFRVVNSYQ